MATRYKLSKDQLERIVENFVMEAASIESKKSPVKNMIPKQGAEAKKHVKNKMSGDMVDQSEGMPSVTPMKKKLSQAPESKKHMSKAKASHNNKAKVVKEGELEEGSIKNAISKVGQKIGATDAPRDIVKNKQAIMDKLNSMKNVEHYVLDKEKVSKEEFMDAMKKNKYSGSLVEIPSQKAVTYKKGRYGFERLSPGITPAG